MKSIYSKMSVLFILLSLSFLLIGSLSYEPGLPGTSRRVFVGAASSVFWGVGSFPSESQAVISSKSCASGQGEGCDDLAEGNEFIRSLQEKSAANADKYAKEARNAYYMKNYPDFFAVVGKNMVKKPDGSFMLVEESELKQLIKDNKIGLEFPKAMGGKVTDLTQKPIMVLKD